MAYINATAQVEIPPPRPERTRDGGMPAVHRAAPRPMAASQPAVSLPHKWRHYSRGRDDIAENTDAEVVQSRGRRCGRRMEQVLDITHRSSKCIGRDAREGLTLDIRTGPAGVLLDMGSRHVGRTTWSCHGGVSEGQIEPSSRSYQGRRRLDMGRTMEHVARLGGARLDTHGGT